MQRKGPGAVEKWIDDQLKGTSVTVVLIGAETSTRSYVGYEIKQSHNKGNGMLGIYIHNMKDVSSKTDTKGNNPFANWSIEQTAMAEATWQIGLRRRQRRLAADGIAGSRVEGGDQWLDGYFSVFTTPIS